MPDLKYCYKDSDVLRNKLDIRDEKRLFMAEVYTDTNNTRYELYSALFEAKLQKMKAENSIRQIQSSIDKISDGE